MNIKVGAIMNRTLRSTRMPKSARGKAPIKALGRAEVQYLMQSKCVDSTFREEK